MYLSGGEIIRWGGRNGKDPKFLFPLSPGKLKIFKYIPSPQFLNPPHFSNIPPSLPPHPHTHTLLESPNCSNIRSPLPPPQSPPHPHSHTQSPTHIHTHTIPPPKFTHTQSPQPTFTHIQSPPGRGLTKSHCRSTSAKPAVRRSPQQRTPQVHRTDIKTVKTFKLTHEL